MMAKNPYKTRAAFSQNPEWLPGREPDKTFRNKQWQTANEVTTGTTCLECNYFNRLSDASTKIQGRIGKVNPCCPSSVNG